MRALITLFAAILASTTPAAAFLVPRANSTNSTCDGLSLVRKSVEALGGWEALTGLKGVTYESKDLYRSRTLTQNYHLASMDRLIVSGGSQSVSFSFRGGNEYDFRLDRTYIPSDYFSFRRLEIVPRNVSLVERSGSDGYACAVKGNYCTLLEPNVTFGYFDSSMTDYLLFESSKLSPALLLKVAESKPVATTIEFWNSTLPAVFADSLNITVAFDPETFLPLVIRSFHDHPVRGLVKNDLHLHGYKEVDGLKFPTQIKTLSDEVQVLEETIVSRVVVNHVFESGWFDADAGEMGTEPSPPIPDPEYPHAILAEYWTNTIWIAKHIGSVAELQVTTPAEDLPNALRLQFPNNSNYVQMVLEFEESVIVFESPPHQTELVIEWVNSTLKKPISHLWASHHHHDHNTDVHKFVEIGAKVIVPEMARAFWSKIPGIDLVTITEEKPFIYSDSKMQARFLWRPNNPHASDWTYAVITTACPTANTSMIAYTGDVFSTGQFFFDPRSTGPWIRQTIDDGLSKNTLVVPTHGTPSPLSGAYEPLGIVYPEFDSTSFRTGGNICLQ